MTDDKISLRCDSDKSGRATIESTSERLIIRGQHLYDRESDYDKIAKLELTEGSTSPFGRSMPAILTLVVTFTKVPTRTGTRKFNPAVPDWYYLTETFSFDLDQRDAVQNLVSAIEERRAKARTR